MNDAPAALDVLRVAVSHGLPGAGLVDAADGTELRVTGEVLELAVRHRVQGLLGKAVDDQLVIGDEAQVAGVRAALSVALAGSATSLATAVLTLEVLGSAGVDARVLKGVALSRLDYADHDERVFADADLLIRRGDHAVALRALDAAGFRRVQPAVRGWWERRFGKAVELLAPSGGELDLHLAITGGYFGARIDHDELWSTSSEPFDLYGVPAHGLDREGRLLQACCHTVLGGGSGLRAVRDVAQLVLISGADWQVVVERAQRDGIDLVIAGAVHAAWTELGLDHRHPLLQWAAAFVPDTVQVEAFGGYRALADEGWAPEGYTMLAALTPIDRVRFLAGLAIPSRASLRARNRSLPEHLRHGAAAVHSTTFASRFRLGGPPKR